MQRWGGGGLLVTDCNINNAVYIYTNIYSLYLKEKVPQTFLAHLWGAYAIPVALSGVRRPS